MTTFDWFWLGFLGLFIIWSVVDVRRLSAYYAAQPRMVDWERVYAMEREIWDGQTFEHAGAPEPKRSDNPFSNPSRSFPIDQEQLEAAAAYLTRNEERERDGIKFVW